MARLIAPYTPFPFAQEPADTPVDSGTPFPITTTRADGVKYFWRVRTWRAQVKNVLYAGPDVYVDDSPEFEVGTHEKNDGFPTPGTEPEILTKYGMNIERSYTVGDSEGGSNEFRLRMYGLDSAVVETITTSLGLQIELDLLLPGSIPPVEIVARSLDGPIPVGQFIIHPTATGDAVAYAAGLYSVAEISGWTVEVHMWPIEYWPYDDGNGPTWDTATGALLKPENLDPGKYVAAES